jgi:hypothetical protein
MYEDLSCPRDWMYVECMNWIARTKMAHTCLCAISRTEKKRTREERIERSKGREGTRTLERTGKWMGHRTTYAHDGCSPYHRLLEMM